MFKKSKVRKILLMSVVSIMLFVNGGGYVFAGSQYDEINKVIMSDQFKKGKASLSEYKDIEEALEGMEPSFYKNALMLKYKTIIDKYGIDTSKAKDVSNKQGDASKDIDSENTLSKNNKKQEAKNIIEDHNGKVNLKHNALIEGYEDGTIRPNGKITREEAAVVVHRAKPNKENLQNPIFTDMDSNRWSYDSVRSINIAGYEDGSFRPTNNITRAEALILLVNNFDIDIERVNVSMKVYKDIYDHWAEDVIMYMAERDIVKGYGDGTFHPDAEISRAEFITLINRAVRYNCKLDKNNPLYQNLLDAYGSEVSNHWAKDALLEATISHN